MPLSFSPPLSLFSKMDFEPFSWSLEDGKRLATYRSTESLEVVQKGTTQRRTTILGVPLFVTHPSASKRFASIVGNPSIFLPLGFA